MRTTPTLQSLALKAYDYFGEDGYPFEESIPSSLDVAVAGYADAEDPEGVTSHVGTELRQHLESRGCDVAQVHVDEFAQMAVTYLRAVYPEADSAKDDGERRMLSHLFWGHLMESRHALGRQEVGGASSAPRPQQAVAVKHTITCSCGAMQTSADEAKLYRFARAHAARQHPAPEHPMETVSSRGAHRPQAIVRRWEEEVVNQGDLAAIDDLSPAGPAEELKEQVTVLRDAFPDLHVTIEDIVEDADEVALRTTLEGTHQGSFRGVAPTGRHVTVEAYEFFRIHDDKIVEHRGGIEEVSLLQQLGVLPERLCV